MIWIPSFEFVSTGAPALLPLNQVSKMWGLASGTIPGTKLEPPAGGPRAWRTMSSLHVRLARVWKLFGVMFVVVHVVKLRRSAAVVFGHF